MDFLSIGEYENLPLHKVVYNKLRESILSGALKPGEKLIENEISKKLNISKTPLREAIRELSQEGLIIHNTRRGIRIIDFSEEDVFEIITLRAELEALGIQLAIEKLREEDFVVLQEIVDQLRDASNKEDKVAMAKSDMDFHRFLMHKAGNSRLEKAWETIASQMTVLLKMIDFYSCTPNFAEINHRRLIDSIRSGDSEKTSATLKSHILLSQELILDHFHRIKQKT